MRAKSSMSDKKSGISSRIALVMPRFGHRPRALDLLRLSVSVQAGVGARPSESLPVIHQISTDYSEGDWKPAEEDQMLKN